MKMKKITFHFFGLNLLLLLTSGVCKAQLKALAPQQKGQLWTVAVHRGWPDYAPTQSWASHEEFYKWLDQQKATSAEEIRQLKKDVIPFIRNKYKHNDATPVELAKALGVLLPDLLSKKNRPLTASEQTALQQQLSSVLQPNEEDTIKRRSTADDDLPISSQSVAKQADSLPTNTNSSPTTAETKNKTTPVIPENNSYMYGLGGLLLGFGVGFVVGRRGSGSGRSKRHSSASSMTESSHNTSSEGETEWPKLQRRTTALPPVDSWDEKPSAQNKSQKQQAPSIAVVPQTEVSDPETTLGHAVGTEVQFEVPQVAPVASINLYGPAPDTPFIEARKLTPQSFPQMPICLRLANPQAAVGSFVLNPHAEQSRLIGNGIRELKAFFDFDLPLPDNFTTITTSNPGKMELRNDTWHLVNKAKIELK